MNTMTIINWEDKRPVQPTHSINNEVFRNAFDRIARRAIPFFDIKYTYCSDLLWDAEAAANLKEGESMFIVVRDCGTTIFHPTQQTNNHRTIACVKAVSHAEANTSRRAVLRVARTEYDTFVVSVLWNRVEDKEV